MKSANVVQPLYEQLSSIVGEPNVLVTETDIAAYLEEPRGLYKSIADAVVFPASVKEISTIIEICAAFGVSVVPQGGNTGLSGGAVSQHGQIILNLRRLNQIIGIDTVNDTITVEAGCILADIQKVALDADRYFPLSLGAEGTCQIGGNLSTNAGGINVLRYGNIRNQVLGLQAVLSDGSIWNDLSELQKNNTGYDLRHLIIGSEGTLGIITQAVLRLFPRPRQVETAFIALRDLEASLELLSRARVDSGSSLSSYELVPGLGVELATRHIPGCRNPLTASYDWSIIMVYSTSGDSHHLREAIETTLSSGIEDGILVDAVISQNEQQARQIWAIREGLREAQAIEGEAFSYDISVKVSKVPELIRRADEKATQLIRDVRCYPFGHVGDGNIHLNFLHTLRKNESGYSSKRLAFNDMVFELVHQLGGSFSAEHGVGLLKLEQMNRYKNPTALNMMRSIKQALDPNGILNPGKVVPGIKYLGAELTDDEP